MPSEPTSSPLLAELRAQSAALRARDRVSAGAAEQSMQEQDRRLWATFRWLDEAMLHLEVIQPPVRHPFAVPGVLAFAGPRYDRGFVSYRRKTLGGVEVLEHIEIFYRLATQTPPVVRVPLAAVPGVEERLRAAQLEFRCTMETDPRRNVRTGCFVVSPHIGASVRLLPDYRRRRVEVALRNVDRFEGLVLDFPAAELDEGALDDLVHFILGETTHFLRRAPLARVGAGAVGAARGAARDAV